MTDLCICKFLIIWDVQGRDGEDLVIVWWLLNTTPFSGSS